ncbi:zona pellucida sperm-binding protein 3-like isoform X1 [Acipenser ruthenus]|uniref:zona pellucida sperm-binding protein 3-like isoform X1 n=1 Tax=Acipenser ruthenus TaxID=7906 RepID=UPI0027421D13|nr:zona pellucida sperm-binding protein 3-like isoform X1 [Acipenser ruthenus]
MMAALWKYVVIALCCVPFAAPQEGNVGYWRAVSTVCGVDSVAVRVLLDYSRSALPLDPSGLLLGPCPPSSSSTGNNMVVFQYGLLDCRFMRMVTANVTSYMNVLTYKPTQRGFYQTPFSQAIVCTYTKPAGWTPPVYNPALGDAYGFGKLEFTMGIMNDDFSAPRTSSLFFLGSLINIAAAVKQQFHMPLMVYMEECVAASTPELSPSSQTYPLITNHGCFVDGQAGNSRFLPRVQTSEIRLVVQAFRFTQLNTDVYIHCRLLAWDPAQLNDPTKKACSFNQRTRSWELLDNPGRSSVCSCCTSNCNLRKRRDTAEEGLRHTAVLGPLRILPEELSAGSQEFYQRSPALSLEEPQQALAWLPVLAAPLLLMAVLGALSLGYYMCVWHHPRLFSKSSRELLVPVPVDEMHTAVGTVSSSSPARHF